MNSQCTIENGDILKGRNICLSDLMSYQFYMKNIDIFERNKNYFDRDFLRIINDIKFSEDMGKDSFEDSNSSSPIKKRSKRRNGVKKKRESAKEGYKNHICQGNCVTLDEKYESVKCLGFGGYGMVLSAMFIENFSKQKVAIKKIGNIFRNKAYAQEAFRELFILSSLKHRNIMGLKRVEYPKHPMNYDDLYLTAELLSTDLRKLIRNVNLPNDHIKSVAYQTLSALKHMHDSGIVHRDLKPSNLLCEWNSGVVKICDFGVSTILNSSYPEISTSHIGTLYYRPIEFLLRDKSIEYIHSPYIKSMDIYSLGVILAEICLNKVLFRAENEIGLLRLMILYMGTPTKEDLLYCSDSVKEIIRKLPTKSGILRDLFPKDFDPVLFDLISRMIQLSPKKRLTVDEALRHQYFSNIFDEEHFKHGKVNFKSVPCFDYVFADRNGISPNSRVDYRMLINKIIHYYHPNKNFQDSSIKNFYVSKGEVDDDDDIKMKECSNGSIIITPI